MCFRRRGCFPVCLPPQTTIALLQTSHFKSLSTRLEHLLHSPDMSRDSMLKDCVSKAPATKTAQSCQMVHICPLWFTLVLPPDNDSHFLGLSLPDVSWANHTFLCLMGKLHFLMFDGQTRQKRRRAEQGSLLVPRFFAANATLFKPLTFHFWKRAAASSLFIEVRFFQCSCDSQIC